MKSLSEIHKKEVLKDRKKRIKRLNNGKYKSNCLIACLLLGWQGGTIHQVSHETGLSVIEILESKDIEKSLEEKGI